LNAILEKEVKKKQLPIVYTSAEGGLIFSNDSRPTCNFGGEEPLDLEARLS
jgi:hypothetical protein